MSNYPWTPGKWRYIDTGRDGGYCNGNIWEIRTGDRLEGLLFSSEPYEEVVSSNHADAQLIALAPEMAEAILDYTGRLVPCAACTDNTWCQPCSTLRTLADRIDQIGSCGTTEKKQ